jgi:glycosyltransferase involved in cell wall biosynthesis
LYRNLAPDVFINVSSSEGVPVSIMEAMSFGIPAIATDAGGNREIVNSSSGFLIPVDCSIETLETTLLSLLNDPPLDAFRMWSDHYKASSNYFLFTTSLRLL